MLLASELIVFVLCFEIQRFLYFINTNIENSVKYEDCLRVSKLVRAFERLSCIQDVIGQKYGFFLLCNLSQIFLNTLHMPLWILNHCVYETSGEQKCSMLKWIMLIVLFFTYIFRFSAILWGCNSISAEVIKF
jgi:hypothetical protein